jgi:hypothetical protein
MPTRQENRATVRALHAQGLSTAHIRNETGLGEMQILRYLSDTTLERRARVSAAHAQHTAKRKAERAESTRLKHLGLSHDPRSGRLIEDGSKARAALDSGLKPFQVIEQLGCSRARFYKALKRFDERQQFIEEVDSNALMD